MKDITKDGCNVICDFCIHLQRKPRDIDDETSYCEVKKEKVSWLGGCDEFSCICKKNKREGEQPC